MHRQLRRPTRRIYPSAEAVAEAKAQAEDEECDGRTLLPQPTPVQQRWRRGRLLQVDAEPDSVLRCYGRLLSVHAAVPCHIVQSGVRAGSNHEVASPS